MRKKTLLFIIIMEICTMLAQAPVVYAAELDTPEVEINLEETQTNSSSITSLVTCGNAKVTASCIYTVSWDEGQAGWINSANFRCYYAKIDNNSYTPVVYGASWINGPTVYQKYTINGSLYTIFMTVDEWGDVTLGMFAG